MTSLYASGDSLYKVPVIYFDVLSSSERSLSAMVRHLGLDARDRELEVRFPREEEKFSQPTGRRLTAADDRSSNGNVID